MQDVKLQEKLTEIGLREGESKVYLALLKLGSTPVNKLKEETGLHRTTIYDFLEKLLNKGLASYVLKGNIKFFKAADPQKLIEFLKEKEHTVESIMPELDKLAKFTQEDIKVEVFRGVEGLKAIFSEVLRIGKDYVIFGIDETMFKQRFGHIMDNFFIKEKEAGFKERILTRDNVEYVYEYETAIYRYLPAESFNPTPTYVFGDNVAILIWEPLTIIKIKNAELADSYLKYFEILWKIAKDKPKSAVLKKN